VGIHQVNRPHSGPKFAQSLVIVRNCRPPSIHSSAVAAVASVACVAIYISTMKPAIKRQVLTAVAELGTLLVDELTAAEITKDHRQLPRSNRRKFRHD
jgi:hypothetical protein